MMNLHGISLLSLNELFRKNWEPNSALYSDRIIALKTLHENGCRTNVHIEPYPTPNFSEQDLEYLLKAVEFIDSIYFSSLNYNSRVSEYKNYPVFYREQAALLKYFCTERGIQYDPGV